MEKYKIGIIGMGQVGSALKRYFEKRNDCDLFLYDINGIGSMDSVNSADYIYICVPTPYKDNECDTGIVDSAIDRLVGEKIVIIKSTIIPGTTDKIQTKYPQHKILFNPEFLTEVTADQDMCYPERQVIGYTDKSYGVVGEIMKQLPLSREEYSVPAFIAEFSKYACNTWFATKVAKNNELYDVFKKFGGDDTQFEQMIDCVSTDKRIGRSHLSIFHKGGRGYGGKCIPKDVRAFISFAKSLEVKTPITDSVDKYNDTFRVSK